MMGKNVISFQSHREKVTLIHSYNLDYDPYETEE